MEVSVSENGGGRRREAWYLVAFLAACLAVSAIGGWVTAGSVDGWYRTLQKPFFNPPDWVFAPVWTTLYVLMAVAAWRVWRYPSSSLRSRALSLFAIQLAVNLAWSFLFFGFQQIGLALLGILLLLGLIIATLLAFRRVERLAGWLLAPYLGWVAFATLLNLALLLLN